MGVRSIRSVMTASLVPINIFFLLFVASLSTMTSVTAFITPMKRSSSFQLGMASKKKIATLIRSEEESTFNEEEEENPTSKKLSSDIQLSSILSDSDDSQAAQTSDRIRANENVLSVLTLAATSTAVCLTVLSETANAAITMPKELTQSFDPASFVPVCGASDSFYRLLQSSAQTIVGRENFIEYGPLIASGLLRIRLELCVVESFFNEAVGPFINQNGLSWVLPVHETVETFLAGTVFAFATTFILVGSTKLVTVIFTYADFFVGGPLRLVGGFFFDRARGKPVTLDIGLGPFKTRVIGPKEIEGEDSKNNKYDYAVDMSSTDVKELPVVVISGGVKAAGQAIGLVREALDAIDLFVGKSLILWVTAYVGIKFLHFKIFPDFP
jgi:hypothetical protein